jgi:redox-sensitive bicupin YhaK (pirin superfamily)
MSFVPSKDPIAGDAPSCDAIETVIVPRATDLGGFFIRRALPHVERRMVGPFIFFDHIGPAVFRSGQGVDVRPHPHIGLATVTFLFEGEITHRDNLGYNAAIRPGAVNWMTAGRGIVHSERTAPELRSGGEHLHGLQCWVALPLVDEEMAPAFEHYDDHALPLVRGEGKVARVITGKAFGQSSPVKTRWDTIFAEVTLDPGTKMPLDADYEERAIFIVEGEIDVGGDRFESERLLVFRPNDRITVTAVSRARIVILGGAAMDGPRHIWWNFVSSSQERINQAKADWKLGRWAPVPGDNSEFIPLPDN